jgi:hypothetical protein
MVLCFVVARGIICGVLLLMRAQCRVTLNVLVNACFMHFMMASFVLGI